MLRKFNVSFTHDPVWLRVATLSIILFFIFLADAIVSFWAPEYLEETFQSSLVMGLIISTSSIVGLLADIMMPQLLKGITVKKLLVMGIVASILFSAILLFTTWLPFILLFLLGMAVWGIYYELLSFASNQFVADATPLKFHSAGWAIIGTFRSLAYFLGPVMATWLLLAGDRPPLFVAIGLALLALVILLITNRKHERQLTVDIHHINFSAELTHWKELFIHVWPILLMSILVGVIDATFWTVGAVYTKDLGQIHPSGSWFLSLHMLPSLFMGFVIAKMQIYQRKKRLAQIFLITSGLFLVLLGFSSAIPWILIMVFISSTNLAISVPLIEAVYSDIVARMGRERQHMIGLSSSTMSIAYIIAPPLSGLIAEEVGARNTFMIIGGFVALVSFILLFTTPKKLKLPQKEIEKWD